MRERRFCKHISILMLALSEDAARNVLEGIKRQQWEFSQYTGRGDVIKYDIFRYITESAPDPNNIIKCLDVYYLSDSSIII